MKYKIHYMYVDILLTRIKCRQVLSSTNILNIKVYIIGNYYNKIIKIQKCIDHRVGGGSWYIVPLVLGQDSVQLLF